MDLEHPTWCAPRRCRAAVGGTHKSAPAEASYGTSRVSAWLQQQPDDEVFLALVTAYHAIGAPTVFLPLPAAQVLLNQAGGLLRRATDGDVA